VNVRGGLNRSRSFPTLAICRPLATQEDRVANDRFESDSRRSEADRWAEFSKEISEMKRLVAKLG
jgi:hypothetical protein